MACFNFFTRSSYKYFGCPCSFSPRLVYSFSYKPPIYSSINLKLIFIRQFSKSVTMNEEVIKLNSNPGVIKEGQAEILEPPGRKVFYNPVQEFNRDLSVLCLHVFSEELIRNKKKGDPNDEKVPFRILEALSATGLRSIRYAKELPNVTQVTANDISEVAIKSMLTNIKHNQVENLVQVSHSNAVTIMHNHSEPSKRFQAVDLDPYGSPTQFLDSAVQCVADGGLLLVTCTDLAILCGNFPETCYAKYGGISLKIPAKHEMALRIVLQCLQSHASRYKRYIVPLLAVSVDFYIRIFVRVFTSASECKNVTRNLSMVYNCTSCNAITLQPLGSVKKGKNENMKNCLPYAPAIESKCIHCGGNHHMGGPIWNGPMHDEKFVTNLLLSEKLLELGTSKRIKGVLTMIREELEVPLYYNTAKLSSILKSHTMPIITMRSAILNGGYRVSFSHASKSSVKTDAPMTFIWDMMREWVKENPVDSKKIEACPTATNILKQPVQHKIDFSLRPDANPLSREMKLTRYQENPMPYWGPGTKSTTHCLEENPKKKRNQNKRVQKRRSSGCTVDKKPKGDDGEHENM